MIALLCMLSSLFSLVGHKKSNITKDSEQLKASCMCVLFVLNNLEKSYMLSYLALFLDYCLLSESI